MLGENKNLKDSEIKPLAPYNSGSLAVSINVTYTKTNKLITALFMVTDIMDKEEILRSKLRILGTNVISDMYSNPTNSDKRISEILSLLDISFAIGLISEMNASILKKEFTKLQESVMELTAKNNPTWLKEFMSDTNDSQDADETMSHIAAKNNMNSIGHDRHVGSTRIGVQKGGNLMKVLSDKVSGMHVHIGKANHSSQSFLSGQNGGQHTSQNTNQNYDILKNKRRNEIVSIIKNKLSVFPTSGGATITDIKNSAEGVLVSCGEKTLQRELVSMVHDNVLKKTGEKRWSKYVLYPKQ